MPDSLFDMLDPYEANAARTRRRAPTREPDPLSLYASQGGVSWDKFLPSEQRAMQSAASLQAGGDYDPRDVFLSALGAVGAPAMGPAQGGATLGSGAIKPIRAYHGSPHDFERFDLSKIGTGEGAQAYGHGLYFAENPAVAKEYRETLAGRGMTPAQGIADAIINTTGYGREKGIGYLQAQMEKNKGIPKFPVSTDEYREAIKLLEAGWEAPKGRMYEVNINAAPEQFLDWDKPLAQQAIAETVAGRVPRDLRKSFDANVASGITGANAYHNYIPSQSFAIREPGGVYGPSGAKTFEEALASVGGDPQRVRTVLNPSKSGASEALREAGIPGIKYLDQGSRGAKEGTSNYVLFRDDIIDIVKKYGLAGAAAIYGISQDEAKAAMDNPKDKKMSIGRQTYGDEE